MSIYDWSTNPANNTSKPGIDWSEGMLPSAVNNSSRQMMADVASFLTGPNFSGSAQITGALTVSGAAVAQSYQTTFTGVGSIRMETGSGTVAGFVSFRNAANAQIAYIGAQAFASPLIIQATAGIAFQNAVTTPSLASTGAITQGGNQVWHAGNLTPGNYAPLASPALTGTPTAPTAAGGTSTTQLATTAFVAAAIGSFAPLASPTFTGTPAAPTATPGTNTTQIASTAFVTAGLALKQNSLGFTAANAAGQTFSGAFGRDANFTLDLVSSNPRITFDSGDYLSYDRTANKLTLFVGSTAVASIDASGNLKVAGNITAATTP